MKSEIIEKEEIVTKIKYPCILKHKQMNIFVLFFEQSKGTVVASVFESLIGDYDNDWNMNIFEQCGNEMTIKFSW